MSWEEEPALPESVMETIQARVKAEMTRNTDRFIETSHRDGHRPVCLAATRCRTQMVPSSARSAPPAAGPIKTTTSATHGGVVQILLRKVDAASSVRWPWDSGSPG